jgi:hypothetical protein
MNAMIGSGALFGLLMLLLAALVAIVLLGLTGMVVFRNRPEKDARDRAAGKSPNRSRATSSGGPSFARTAGGRSSWGFC